MNPIKPLLFVAMAGLLLGSCTDREEPASVRGMAPVYISKDIAHTITTKGPQVMNEPGKIYIYGGYLFIVEKAKGVHILDNSDPATPTKLGFIGIPGVMDVAVKGHTLYADNITDLIAFDISDISNITLSKRVKDVYPIVNQLYPVNYTGYFECADTTKGYVIGWEEATLIAPKCYRSGGDNGTLFIE